MTFTIKTRLLALTSLTLAMMLVLGATSYRSLNSTGNGMSQLLGSSDILRNHMEADMMHDALRADVLAVLLATTDAEIREADASSMEHIGHFRQMIRENQLKASTDDVRSALDQVGSPLEQYIQKGEALIKLAHKSRPEAAALLPDFLSAFSELEGRMSSVSDVIEKRAAEDRNSALAVIALAKVVGLATIAVALIVSLGAAMWNIRSITSRLQRASRVADSIAGGELGHRIDVGMHDEIGALLTSLRQMDAKLVQTVEGVRSDATSVAFAARELVKGSDDLNERTQQQAAALEETAASMEQMTATVKQNADNAREANQLVAEACNSAERGSSVMASAVSAMREINESSSRIANIIGVIDEIAFQTNLLALNAAVEAARAGEQGRGFAVVASEVRNLAQRSAQAAREIKGLITDSTEKVKTGTEHVDASGVTLKEIVTNVQKVTEFVSAIAAASHEQATGIDQVNLAVTQMDSTTQQNAALVEESTSASKSMEAQAESLMRQMAFFSVQSPGVQPSRGPARSPGYVRSSTGPSSYTSALSAPDAVRGNQDDLDHAHAA
jgi:methyl-accepting chemotaxis protein